MSAQAGARAKGPKFDLTILEPLAAWRAAMLKRRRAAKALQAEVTPNEKATAAQVLARAQTYEKQAQAQLESVLRSSVEAEEP